MKKRITNILTVVLIVVTTGLFKSCKEEKKKETHVETAELKKELAFEQRKIVDSARFWWAHTPADVTGDGIADLVFIDNNSAGGHLAYYKGQKEEGLWEHHVIAENPPTGALFASGDLEAIDIDGDEDIDVIGVKHPGEWTDAGATAELFWYENADDGWKAHNIGTVPDAVKDVSFIDFNKDGKRDVSILTFDEHTLSVFQQNSADDWERVQFIQNEILHEGMAVGDVDGDGYADIVATGMVYYNPGGDLKKPWKEENIDEKWNNQEGDWSRNGTKTFMHDLDDDGRVEIFMAHSERSGYPLAIYKKVNDKWESTTIADSIAANHTLQVYDFDLDGDYDILAGINKGRAVNLDKTDFSVYVFLNEGNNTDFKRTTIEKNGIYNGQAIDYDADGDMDIFRYPDHEATDFYVLENKVQ